MNKIEIRIEETSGIFQLRVVTDVFVQNGDCRPLDQLSAGARYIFEINDCHKGTKDKGMITIFFQFVLLNAHCCLHENKLELKQVQKKVVEWKRCAPHAGS